MDLTTQQSTGCAHIVRQQPDCSQGAAEWSDPFLPERFDLLPKPFFVQFVLKPVAATECSDDSFNPCFSQPLCVGLRNLDRHREELFKVEVALVVDCPFDRLNYGLAVGCTNEAQVSQGRYSSHYFKKSEHFVFFHTVKLIQ